MTAAPLSHRIGLSLKALSLRNTTFHLEAVVSVRRQGYNSCSWAPGSTVICLKILQVNWYSLDRSSQLTGKLIFPTFTKFSFILFLLHNFKMPKYRHSIQRIALWERQCQSGLLELYVEYRTHFSYYVWCYFDSVTFSTRKQMWSEVPSVTKMEYMA